MSKESLTELLPNNRLYNAIEHTTFSPSIKDMNFLILCRGIIVPTQLPSNTRSKTMTLQISGNCSTITLSTRWVEIYSKTGRALPWYCKSHAHFAKIF